MKRRDSGCLKIKDLRDGDKNVFLNVKVVYKSSIFQTKSSQRMFKAEFQDEEGSKISCVCFDGGFYRHHDDDNSEADKKAAQFTDLFNCLDVGKFYEIEGGNCKFSNYSKKLELSLGSYTKAKEINAFVISSYGNNSFNNNNNNNTGGVQQQYQQQSFQKDNQDKVFVTKDDFESQNVGDYINFQGKCTAQYEKRAFRNGNGFLKNVYFVGAKGTFFGDFADRDFQIGKTYQITNVKVGSYNDKKNFSTTKSTQIDEIEGDETGDKRGRTTDFERDSKKQKFQGYQY